MDRCIKVCCRVRPLGGLDLDLGAHEGGMEPRKCSPQGCCGSASRESTPTNGIEHLPKHDIADGHLKSAVLGPSVNRRGSCSITTSRADVSRLLTSSDGAKVVMNGATRASGRRRDRDRWDFTFDDVLENGCEQEEVYRRCASDIVDSVLAGVNGTIMACKWCVEVCLPVSLRT